MATKPYREGQTWSFRLRLKGQDIYRTGFGTEGAARRETERLQQKLREAGKPKHDGPWQTTVAKAIQLYALERLPAMKGARQEAGRINAVLRAAGLDVVKVTPLESTATGAEENKNSGLYWTVALVPESGARKIPKGLGAHRQNQRDRKARSDRLRQVLAKCTFAQVMSYHVQELMDAMQGDGAKPATIGLERALLRRLFNYARQMWGWVEPARNPARDLVLPPVNNGRTRILTNAEWRRICVALEHARNDYVAPALALLLETSMRVSEPLLQARWPDIDWETCILHLRDAKAGPRDVPLSPPAMEVLSALRVLRDAKQRDIDDGRSRATPRDEADERILPITYELLKAAWNRACKEAKVEDAHIHDLRHTAATRFTLELNGNLPVLKVITGHRTFSQLTRYINLKPEDVVRLLHGRPLTEDSAPAGMRMAKPELVEPLPPANWSVTERPSNVIPMVRRVR